MTVSAPEIGSKYARTSIGLIEDLLSSSGRQDYAVRLWDGTTWSSDPTIEPRFTLVLQHPGAMRSMFVPPDEMSLFEAYVYDDFDVEGDIESLIAILDQYIDENGKMGRLDQLRFGARLLSLPKESRRRPDWQGAKLRGKRHSRERDRQAISYHYDQSNEFYELFLDPYMLYSCAYFEAAQDSLESAQERKLDYVCRKLRLRPGEKLLDLGCGWGGLTLYAAQHYGVRAHGITISEEQARWVNDRIAAAGLGDRCSVEVRDYRDLEGSELYDKAAAMAVLEHVGESMFPVFFQKAWSMLRPEGVLFTQAISSPGRTWALDSSNFIGRYVFPDGELLPIGATLQAAEATGFDVRDVESLREHYVMTLRHWVRRLESREDEARDLLGEEGYRIYRLYMAVAAHGFKSRRITVYQALFSKPLRGESNLPLTRSDWYA